MNSERQNDYVFAIRLVSEQIYPERLIPVATEPASLCRALISWLLIQAKLDRSPIGQMRKIMGEAIRKETAMIEAAL